MNRQELIDQIKIKKSFLCIGLDAEQSKLPLHLRQDPKGIVTFCKSIIDQTHDLAVAYKPNIAFFECLGSRGWDMLAEISDYIPENIFTIADAKRGDIGNTSRMYAKCFFEEYNFDSVTVAPYMGEDSVRPFLEFDDKWVILLGLTSNIGSNDFQQLHVKGRPLYEHVIERACTWANADQMMFVVGATQSKYIGEIRNLAKDYFFLVPGIGAQGGDLHGTVCEGRNIDIGLLINSSRAIIYGSQGEDYAEKARVEALKVVEEMGKYME